VASTVVPICSFHSGMQEVALTKLILMHELDRLHNCFRPIKPINLAWILATTAPKFFGIKIVNLKLVGKTCLKWLLHGRRARKLAECDCLNLASHAVPSVLGTAGPLGILANLQSIFFIRLPSSLRGR
jgi:hypothetical protein